MSCAAIFTASVIAPIQIFADAERLGELEIGRGAVYWCGRNRRSAKRINWSRFADYLDDIAYR
jgi:hypothetical protein